MFDWWSRMSLRYSAGGETQVSRNDIPIFSSNIRNQPSRGKTQVIEVIGGCKTGPMIMRNPQYEVHYRNVRENIGPPKLPRELIVQIVYLACQTIVQDHKELGTSSSKDLLSLAGIDSSMHDYVLSHFILQSLQLRGARQIHSFANSLSSNKLGICRLALKIRRLYILRPTPNTKDGHTVFNDTEELGKFQRTINVPMRTILKHCTELEHLALEIPANALDIRWPESGQTRGGIVLLGQNLKQLTTMLSIYGGDLNENLWDNSYGNPNLRTSRWANLTHLHLDGPRLRINSLSVLGICELPQLTHLALMMPWIVHATINVTGISPQLLKRHAKTIERATDLTERESVLQLLYSGLGHQLKSFYLICHDIDDYVGNVKNLGPWFRALQWHEYSSKHLQKGSLLSGQEEIISSNTKLKLITVSLGKKLDELIDPHPVMVGSWMMQRTVKETHWNFEDGEKDEFEGREISISVEEWKAPSVPSKNRISPSLTEHTSTPYPTYANTQPATSAGIDDLD